jgi:mono/diheme cytochrome c family protein
MIPFYRTLPILLLAAASAVAQPTPAAGTPEFFENKIRPILADSCFGCHTSSALGGLRLDSLEAMKKGGKRGPALVAGDLENSLLIKAIRQTDPDLKMPSGGKLKPAQIADLEAWVKAGAVWPADASSAAPRRDGVLSEERRKFWSLLPLANPSVPGVKDTKWPKTDIDRFVLSRLEQEGLHPVAPANKHDLLRRASLDLTGLLPTPDDYAAFEKDSSPNAYAKIVDRLLASPAYGERWGRIWLDVARYGEDDYRSLNPFPRGYRPYTNAWAYRDWVVQAFNDDLPYDQFVKAQLAGDLMDPKVRYKMLPATGFLGLGPWYYDNGSNEVTRADERHDRVDAVTRGFLGLTAQCARCHDHKYDPIPQKDYYALAGVFYNTIYEEYPRAPKKVVAEYTHLEDELDKAQKIQQDFSQGLANQLSRSLAYHTANYLMGVWEVSGKQKKEMATVVDSRRLDYELLDRWVKYMGKATDKYPNKNDWQALMKKGGGTKDEAQKLADRFQKELIETMLEKNEIDSENKVIEDKDIEGTKPKKRTDKPSNFVSNRDFNPGSWLQLKSLPEQQNNFWTEIFQRELKDSDDPNAMGENGMRNIKPGVLLFRGWGLEARVGPEAQARLKSIQEDIQATRKKIEPYYPFIHGVKDREKPEELKLALRGNPETLGDPVPRHFLTVLSKGPEPTPLTQGSGRLQLAELIVEQPIAMRVMVNRIWKGHFGTGIVDSPSNFGFGGERPTNPALLEYLAQSFLKSGMSVKQLHREIMLSNVYQLSTADNQLASEKDSGNRLYWRANRKRLDAEQVRDTILQVAGNLDEGIGGPSQELNPENHRRTVYGQVSRYKLDSYLQLFDFPTPNISAEKRFTTTVPLQRLFLMNSDFVQLESEELVKRVSPEPDNPARIRKLYSLVYGRDPKPTELQVGLEYLRTEPLREYEEAKKKEKEDAAKKGPGGRRRGGGGEGKDGKDEPTTDAKVDPKAEAKAEAPETPEAGGQVPPAEDPAAAMGMGMMGGMGRRGGAPKAVEVKYDATVWGRYAKILLSSTEFLFVN